MASAARVVRQGIAVLAQVGALLPAAAREPDESPLDEMNAGMAKMCLAPLAADGTVQPTLRLAATFQSMAGSSGDLAAMVTNIEAYSSVDVKAGRYESAQRRLEECAATAVRAADLASEAICTNNLGVVFGARGQYAASKAMFERSLERYRAIKPTPVAALPRYQPGQDWMEMIAKVSAPRFAALGVERAELNLGNLALALGQIEQAQAHFQRALDGHPPTAALACRAAAANDLARLYGRLGRHADADALIKRHAEGRMVAEDDKLNYLDMGAVAMGAVAAAGADDATTTAKASPRANARKSATDDEEDNGQSLSDPMSVRDDTALRKLFDDAAQSERDRQPARAAALYAQGALRAAAAQRPEVELSARTALMRLHTAAGQPAVAIYHGKRAASLVQGLRGGRTEAQLPRAARRSYVRDRQQVHLQLAQRLFDQQRLGDAEQVLRLLKEDEGQQFQRTAGRSGDVALPELPQEKSARQQFEEAAQALRRNDESRIAIPTARILTLGETATIAQIEQQRLDTAAVLVEFLDARKKGSSTKLEELLRGQPREVQSIAIDRFGDRGQQLVAALRGLAEDAPQFKATRASPQQLARIAESLRRADEIQAAFAPLLQAMRHAPARSAAQQVEAAINDAPMFQMMQAAMAQRESGSAALSPERAQQLMQAHMARGGAVAQTMQEMSQTMSQQRGATEPLNRAYGIAMAHYMAAMGGERDPGRIAKLDAALKGMPADLLESFATFVRGQGESMAGAQAALADDSPGLDRLAFVGAVAAIANSARKIDDLPSLLAAAKDAARKNKPGVGAGLRGNADRVRQAQAELEQAIERARDSATTTFAKQFKDAYAATPSQRAEKAREDEEKRQLSLFLIEPLQALWRADMARERIEARQQQLDAAMAAHLGSATPNAAMAPDETIALLAKQSTPTALLYYLPGDDRLDILLVTAKGRKAWRVDLPRAELDARVGRLQAALRNRFVDPRPEARAMHDTLFTPVAAAALAESGAQVVALSLAGRLRFVPFAALHDGERWLAERYAIAVQPGARLSDVLKPASAPWKVAAFGATAGGAGLGALPSVRAELSSIVRQGDRGALPGRAWLDRDFTANALRTALAGDSNVIHIASHFKFEPGDAAASFLLLGDGNQLTLQELGGPAYRFDRTELVTLSACQTGLSEDDSFGQEVDGLAALFMAQGAPSVLASLWQVADDSTASLMDTLYRARERREPGKVSVTRAQALQQAQLAMIADGANGRAAAVAPGVGEAARGASRVGEGVVAGKGTALGRGHPYHWAPFVLMGNWQ